VHRAWGAYPDTVLTFPDAGIVVDLRHPLTPAIRRHLQDLGLPGPFAVVTASNPLGGHLDDHSNRRLLAVLASQIASRFPGARKALGGSPDGRHQEPGWAIPASLEEARRLAEEFLQNALFWYDGDRFLIVPVHAPGEPLGLPCPLEISPPARDDC